MAGLPQLLFAGSPASMSFVFAGVRLKCSVFNALRTIDCTAIRTIAEKAALFQRSATAITAEAAAGDGHQAFGVVSHSSRLLVYPHQPLPDTGDAFSHIDPGQAGPDRNPLHRAGIGYQTHGVGRVSDRHIGGSL